MTVIRKGFSNFTRDYGAQESSGLSQLVDAVVPVTLVDDCTYYVERTNPTYTTRAVQAATAAVFSYCGISCTTTPIRILGLELAILPATGSVVARIGIANLITANQVDSIADANRFLRGQAAPTVAILAGTSTVSPNAGGYKLYDATDTHWLVDSPFTRTGPDNRGMLLRPGEFLFVGGLVVNEVLQVNFAWEELRYGLPPNPPNLA